MNRDAFLVNLRMADDAPDEEPFSQAAQRLADHDADRRVLLASQRALIEQQSGVIQRQWDYIEQLKQTISGHEQAGMEGLIRDYNDHQRIEQQAKEIERLQAQLAESEKAAYDVAGTIEGLKAQLATAKGELEHWTHDSFKRRETALREALQGILDIGKRDMSNPKYDGYFETAREALREPA